MEDLRSSIEKAADFHGHLGPFLVIGVRMGIAGLRELKTDRNDKSLRVVVNVKRAAPYSCVIDGIQISTRCTAGNGKLRVMDQPEMISAEFQTSKRGHLVVSVKQSVLKKLEREMPKDLSSYEVIKLARWIASLSKGELFSLREKNGRGWPSTHPDLDVARQRLEQQNFVLVVAKGGRVIFETKSPGIRGLLETLRQHGDHMKGSSAADKIVGKAAALLLVYSGVEAVFALTASDGGIQVLEDHGVFHMYRRRVPCILDSLKVDVCPFEKLTADVSDPKEAFKILKAHSA